MLKVFSFSKLVEGVKMKRLVCFVLIYSLILISSCSLPERVTKDYEPFQNHSVDVLLTKADSTELFLNKRDYTVEGDTIFISELGNSDISMIALNDIAFIEVEMFNLPLTLLFSAGVVLLASYLYLAFFWEGLNVNVPASN